jgi:serine acetyltransferase
MKLMYGLTQLFIRLITRIGSAIYCSQFAECGRGCRLGLGAVLVGARFVNLGKNVTIGKDVWLNAKDERGHGKASLTIGDGTYLGRMVQINAWSSVVIGREVLIGDRVLITDADHNFSDTAAPILRQGDYFRGPVVLSDGCWIGAGAVILPGVNIGRNAVVAANAVVTRDVPGLTIAAGVPAQIIKHVQAG